MSSVLDEESCRMAVSAVPEVVERVYAAYLLNQDVGVSMLVEEIVAFEAVRDADGSRKLVKDFIKCVVACPEMERVGEWLTGVGHG